MSWNPPDVFSLRNLWSVSETILYLTTTICHPFCVPFKSLLMIHLTTPDLRWQQKFRKYTRRFQKRNLLREMKRFKFVIESSCFRTESRILEPLVSGKGLNTQRSNRNLNGICETESSYTWTTIFHLSWILKLFYHPTTNMPFASLLMYILASHLLTEMHSHKVSCVDWSQKGVSYDR